MIRNILLLAIIAFFVTSCDPKPRIPGGPACEDLCKTFDPNNLIFNNLDRYNIYVKYGNSASGDQVTFTRSDMIPNGGSRNLDFINAGFNHYHFYKDPGCTDLIAKLVVKNTQPGLVNLCAIDVLHTNSFPPSRVQISNTGFNIVLRELQMTDWHNWDLRYPSTGNTFNIDRCFKETLSTTPSNMFRHMYFYDRSDPGNYYYPFSQIVYLNSNTSKIRFVKITSK